MMIVLGGTVFAIMVEYPNWFADVPSSLEATRNFYKVLHPGFFFQIFGPLMLVTGVAFSIAGWRLTGVRNLVLISIAIFVAVELLTFFYIYPRLGIMFGSDAGLRSVDALKQAAAEFTLADRIRTGMAFTAGCISLVALFRFFKERYSMA